MLAAGMKGVEGKYELMPAMEKNIFHMSAEEKKKEGIDALPGSLLEAIELMEGSKLAKETLGDHVFNKLLENKKMEWDRFRIHVSKYEIENYLPML